MLKACRGSMMLAVIAGTMLAGGMARADDATDAKKAVENFVAAWQTGDAKAMRGTLVVTPAKEKDLTTILESVAAVSRMQRVAMEKFGVQASEQFSDGSEQFAARMKKVKEGPIKVTGDSAVLTIAPDETTRTRGGTLIIVKREGAWKIDGGSLFDITPALVNFSSKLTTIANQIAREINDNKYTAAVDAYHEFNTRYANAVRDAETPAESRPAK
jgi:hypothetical protein